MYIPQNKEDLAKYICQGYKHISGSDGSDVTTNDLIDKTYGIYMSPEGLFFKVEFSGKKGVRQYMGYDHSQPDYINVISFTAKTCEELMFPYNLKATDNRFSTTLKMWIASLFRSRPAVASA